MLPRGLTLICFSIWFGLACAGLGRTRHLRRLVRLELNTSTLPGDQWFLQKLDHYDITNTQTWWQRYQSNDTWFNNSQNSPIFLMLGGEGSADAAWVVEGQMMDLAKKYNALAFQLEHRFYGKSHPTGDLSVENLRYLSSEQALFDVAYFIEGMNNKYKFTKNNKWITFGGSYSGSLAAWARYKYPHLIHAAVSTSGPLLATANFNQYDEVVRYVLEDSNNACEKNVHKAALKVEELLTKPEGPSLLTQKFNLCQPLDVDNKKDVSNFAETLAGNFQGIVQYNHDNRIPSPPSLTVHDLCNVMTNVTGGDLIDKYAAVNALINGNACLDITYHSYVQEMRGIKFGETEGSRQWVYQTCTEFGFYQTSSSRKELFGSLFNLQFFIDQCKDIFGDDFDHNRLNEAIKRTNLMYGKLTLEVSNVVFVQGSADPWHVLGIYESSNLQAPAILIQGTAHCANMYPPSSNDSEQLTEARKKVEKILGEWLSN